MRTRSDRLAGITNGVDYDVWNPETDPHITANFSADDLTAKHDCKVDLLQRFGLPIEPERPIIAIISRLVAQKGYDLIRGAAHRILETGAFFIALGAGALACAKLPSLATTSSPSEIIKAASRYRIAELLAPWLSLIGLNLPNEVHCEH
jgi:glycogen synthase